MLQQHAPVRVGIFAQHLSVPPSDVLQGLIESFLWTTAVLQGLIKPVPLTMAGTFGA